LEAGEFGPALETAQAVRDAQQRGHFMRLIVAAQVKAGEFDAAFDSINRIPNPRLRSQSRGNLATEQALAGGASLADFEQLIELIQQETSGPWMDIEGTGGTISSFDTGVR